MKTENHNRLHHFSSFLKELITSLNSHDTYIHPISLKELSVIKEIQTSILNDVSMSVNNGNKLEKLTFLNEISNFLEQTAFSKQLNNTSSVEVNATDKIDYHFLSLIEKAPFLCLADIFDYFSLDKLILYWNKWINNILCCPDCIYENTDDRERVLGLSAAFKLLIHALYAATHKWLKSRNLPEYEYWKYLPSADYISSNLNDYTIIQNFSKLYLIENTQKELWNILNVVVSLPIADNKERGEIIMVYESFLSILKTPIILTRLYPELF